VSLFRERLMFLQGIAIFVHSLACRPQREQSLLLLASSSDVGYRTEAVADAPHSLLK
jgi:hypothetical protein